MVGCNNKASSKGYCHTHYTRFWKFGDANTVHRSHYSSNLREDEASFNVLYGKYKERASKKDLEFSLSKQFFMIITSSNCRYCKCAPYQKAKTASAIKPYIYCGVDRVNSSLGYIEENVVPCCKRCNVAKNNMTELEFKEWIILVFNNYVNGVNK